MREREKEREREREKKKLFITRIAQKKRQLCT